MRMETVALVAVAAVAFVLYQRQKTAPSMGTMPVGGDVPPARQQQSAPRDMGGRLLQAGRAGADAALRPQALQQTVGLAGAGAALGGTVGGAVGTGVGAAFAGVGAPVGGAVGTAVGVAAGAAAGGAAGLLASGGKAAAESFFSGGGLF